MKTGIEIFLIHEIFLLIHSEIFHHSSPFPDEGQHQVAVNIILILGVVDRIPNDILLLCDEAHSRNSCRKKPTLPRFRLTVCILLLQSPISGTTPWHDEGIPFPLNEKHKIKSNLYFRKYRHLERQAHTPKKSVKAIKVCTRIRTMHITRPSFFEPATRCTTVRHHRRPDSPLPADPDRCHSVSDRYSTMRPHLASSPPAALASSAAARRLHGRYSRPPGVVWKCYHLPDWRLLPRQQQRRLRSPETRTLLVSRTRTNFGDRAFSAAGPRVRQYLSTDRRQPGLSYIQPFQTVAEDIFIWSVGPKRSVNFPLTALLKILLLTYPEKCKTSLSIVSTRTFRYWIVKRHCANTASTWSLYVSRNPDLYGTLLHFTSVSDDNITAARNRDHGGVTFHSSKYLITQMLSSKQPVMMDFHLFLLLLINFLSSSSS